MRFKKGLYKGDLAQVVRSSAENQKVVVRVVPRLDWQKVNGGSYSASTVRHPQKLFDPSKVEEGKVERRKIPKYGRADEVIDRKDDIMIIIIMMMMMTMMI